MKILFLIPIILLFSCKEHTATVTDVPEPAFQTDSLSVPEPKHQTKYYLVVMAVEEPVSVKRDSKVEGEQVEWASRYYCTDISTLDTPLTEDQKYQHLDRFENNLREKHLNSLNARFTAMSRKAVATIMSREFLIFDSYKEASLARQEILNGTYEFTENLNELYK